jgi:hypothetical protein
MKMAKPSARDIDAGGDLLSIMQTIDSGYGPPQTTLDGPESLDEALEDDYFDCENPAHLRGLYNSLAALHRRAPGFPGRVLGGMCYVICYHKNQFLDPSKNYLALHPDVIEGLELLAERREDFIPRLVREAHAAVTEAIEAAAARHLAEMKSAAA